ncbi:uncharacterized protein LOC117180314 [Belonocnema kinseyi]|uniref:uncharacterized protein LOC117180314 n=1 Tax=Belonocnema kinseyi TaxID=2817044 RepID=UPI00143D4751|nr:uncharacterized protein LOC117180314 [Belonocnema kinseyi]
MTSEIVSSLKLYSGIIVFVNDVESCFATCLTFTMGVSAMILCFQGVMIVARIDELDFFMRFATNFLAQAVRLFYNCYTGQLLMNSSEVVSNYMLVILVTILKLNYFSVEIRFDKTINKGWF